MVLLILICQWLFRIVRIKVNNCPIPVDLWISYKKEEEVNSLLWEMKEDFHLDSRK